MGLLQRVPILLCLLQDQHLLQYVINFFLAYKGCLCVCLFLLWQLSASVTILAKWVLGIAVLAVSIVVGVQRVAGVGEVCFTIVVELDVLLASGSGIFYATNKAAQAVSQNLTSRVTSVPRVVDLIGGQISHDLNFVSLALSHLGPELFHALRQLLVEHVGSAYLISQTFVLLQPFLDAFLDLFNLMLRRI